jgi:FkbM family methyltransferase
VSELHVSGWFGDFLVELQGDYYGAEYWNLFTSREYEADLMNFLELYVNSKSDFLDIGAANGAMSLIAGKLGARVLSFEAAPHIFSIAKRNLQLNSELLNNVQVVNKAIGKDAGTLIFSSSSNPKILSSILFSSNVDSQIPIEVIPLDLAIKEFHKDDRNLVLKIDIEGAEWEVFKNLELLSALRSNRALVYLAIHPGFYRPLKRKSLWPKRIRKVIWQIRNGIDTYRLFNSLSSIAVIKKTNYEVIRNPKNCVMLMFGGYLEFILDFRDIDSNAIKS